MSKLIVFSDHWSGHPSSSQHLIRRLLPRHSVLWVNTIGTRRMRWTQADMLRAAVMLRAWTEGPRPVLDTGRGLKVISPPMWPGFRTSIQRRVNAWLIRAAVKRVLGPRRRGEQRIAVTTLPITADVIGSLEVDRRAYYCVDDFSTWPGLDGRVMHEMERRQLRSVDLIIAASKPLQDQFVALGREAHLLTHGVDLDHWSVRSATSREQVPARVPGDTAIGPCPVGGESLAELPGWWSALGHPIVLFWGLIDRRLDLSWCRAIAEGLGASGNLVLVGPTQEPDPALSTLPRVLLPGQIPYEQLPTLAAMADVLVMPYADLPVTRAMQPLKLKEYLATGKPVVVRNLPATHDWDDAADVVCTAEQLLKVVRKRIAGGVPAAQLRARRRLINESWEQKALHFEALILGNPFP